MADTEGGIGLSGIGLSGTGLGGISSGATGTASGTTTETRPDQPGEAASAGASVPGRRAWHAGAATGIGSLPGDSADEATRTVAGELPELPHLVELPDRGVGADMAGRTAALLVEIYSEVVPSGWRITRRPGRDIQRAKDFLQWDLDAAQQHYEGADWVKTQVCGPWTLAALLELSNGHRALTDTGAVDDLALSLAEGVLAHVDELARRLPGTGVVVQLDEPLLPSVLAGNLPTASGFGTVRAVAGQRAAEVLTVVTEMLAEHPRIAHCCHPAAPLGLLRAAGFDALSVDLTEVGSAAARLDPIGEAIEAGLLLLGGTVSGVSGATSGPRTPLQTWAAPILQTWDRLGFNRSRLPEVVVPTPTCGLAGASADWAVRAMQICRELAQALQDLPESW